MKNIFNVRKSGRFVQASDFDKRKKVKCETGDLTDERKYYFLNGSEEKEVFLKICKEFEIFYSEFEKEELLLDFLDGDLIQPYHYGEKKISIILEEGIVANANFDITRFVNWVKNIHMCPCCGKNVVNEWEICTVCGWESNLVQEDEPDFDGCANQMSLNEARKAYKEGKKVY